jgi:hypothetical protein
MFVVEQTQPQTSHVGGVPEKDRITMHLPQDRLTVIGFASAGIILCSLNCDKRT